MTLEKTLYVNPDIEEERAEKILGLQHPLRVDEIQFGVFYRPAYPTYPKMVSRAFSIEWEHSYTQKSLGWLRFEYDHKLIRVEVIPTILELFVIARMFLAARRSDDGRNW
jgi:RNA-dependent RNA polymerase